MTELLLEKRNQHLLTKQNWAFNSAVRLLEKPNAPLTVSLRLNENTVSVNAHVCQWHVYPMLCTRDDGVDKHYDSIGFFFVCFVCCPGFNPPLHPVFSGSASDPCGFTAPVSLILSWAWVGWNFVHQGFFWVLWSPNHTSLWIGYI